MVDRSGAKRKAAAQALAHTFKTTCKASRLITNTLAKDKEISDRWRGFAGHRRRPASVEPGRARSGRCAGRSRARRLSAAVAPYMRSRPNGSARSGCRTGIAMRRCRRCRRHRWLDRGRNTSSKPMARSRRKWRVAEALFANAGSMRGAGRARRRALFRASDHAVGASYRAAQLSGQAARRDDARA